MKIIESPTVYNVFEKELALIQDSDIREFVIDVFGLICPPYFWYIPGSVCGHHPPICRLRGGLVHHVKLAVVFADTFLDMLDIGEADLWYSQTIAAVLLHDMTKRGWTEDELKTWPDHRIANRSHGRYCADVLKDYLDSQHFAVKIKLNSIITAIRLHMGRWTQDVTPEEMHELANNVVVRTTHLADYAASRPLHHYLAERHTDQSMRYLR